MTHTLAVDSRQDRESRQHSRFQELHESDQEFRAAEPESSVADAAQELSPNLARVVAEIMTRYSDRPALGSRAREIARVDDANTLRLLPRFDTITYGQAWNDAGALASALTHDAFGIAPGDFFATLGFASAEYVIAELATIRLGAIAVPLQAGATAGQLSAIAAEVEPVVLAADVDNLSVAVQVATQCRSIRRIVVLDYDDALDVHARIMKSAHENAEQVGIVIRPLTELVRDGGQLPEVPLPDAEDPDRLATLIYTSGSTGTPKGAMHTERIVCGAWTGAWHHTGASSESVDRPAFPVITLDYLPMSHLAGRGLVFSALAAGGTVHFAGASDLSTLFEDFALARPTMALLIPRVCEMIRHNVLAEIDREVERSAGEDEDRVRRDVLERFRNDRFGGRILAAMVGTAPIATEVKDFVTELLDIQVRDNYGSTEAGMVLHDGVIARPPVIEYKLDDVPELGYFSTDTPHPRGELLLKTSSIIPGYYKRPDVTADVFDSEGFYRTGDVVAEIEPDRLAYVDRRKNVLKLAQGEFVALARLEAVFGTSELVDQIFLYGNSQRAYLLAVVVPAQPDTTTASIIESLQEIARTESLNSYEIPRDVTIEHQPFTQDNGLLSGAGKQLRPKLVERYGADLERRYAELESGQNERLRELRRSGADAPVLTTVGDAAQALLGCDGSDVRPDAHFSDLGGDSLSALTFSTLLRDIYGVDVPVGVITGPAMDLSALADYITSARNNDSDTATFASVHGRDATVAHASDLRLSAFLDETFIDTAHHVSGPRTRTETVLLTGANGYLGRFLCLEWLERMAEVGGTVVCLVRGRSHSDARSRLDAAFDSGDEELSAHYRALADSALEVVAGDLGSPRFGLDHDEFAALAERVDRIVHPAALVNHALPYEHLFGPNVVGTAEVIRLALTDHVKPVTYLSTVAVAVGVDNFRENGDIRTDSPSRAVDDSYANGYGNSKWAGEVLLRNAFDEFGLPVSVFRSDMILAHSRWSGQLNVPDVFTRLILSVVATGLAPRTFYATGTGAPTDESGRPLAHYDGLPADFSAAAITSIAGADASDYRTFDILNPHDDNVSLDTFVDWIREAGRDIEIVDNFDEWFERFSAAVEALPEKQRSHSLLPLIQSYAQPQQPSSGAMLPADEFAAAVGEIPHLGRGLIEKYLSDLVVLGLVSKR
ncbi:carboxylic acid reductase [Rhodococcoides yunnanense]|uniref:Carboxylic acid reductase n=1 Tax=Rhodococcoides yunnanense TaxID=278209 RepID=A0ABU4BCL6_9NOCA|nr:carboxylic acid reductase [Rhodococcus yunnanensis]MDV6261849.1 carboxylic acid reductase [Rhodococcus yunnanensis]